MDIQSMKPLNDHVLVRRIEAEEKTPGGILIPENAKEKPQRGTVIAVGPGRVDHGQRVPLTVQPGDCVLFAKYAGTEIEGHIIMREEDILAVAGK